MKNISVHKVVTALVRCGGVISSAAKMLHTTTINIHRIIDEHPEIQDQMEKCHSDLIDEALKSAKELVDNRDREMTKFVLDRLGESRGIRGSRKDVKLTGDPNHPVVTQNNIDLSELSDDELETLGKVLEGLK